MSCPSDWQAIELSTDNNGALVMAQAGQATPVDRAARRLWGAPVALSTAIAAGTGIVADFEAATRLWVNEEAQVKWSENVADDFVRNYVRLRVEGRFGFGVLRPLAVVEVDLTAA